MKLLLQNDTIELEIVLMPQGIAKVRSKGRALAGGHWEQQDNSLEVDLPSDLLLNDPHDPESLVFHITHRDE